MKTVEIKKNNNRGYDLYLRGHLAIVGESLKTLENLRKVIEQGRGNR